MPETEADATRIQVPGWGNIPRSWLYVPGKLYEFGVRLRLALYETGYLKPKVLSNPVISVGNITLGGTGKTPLVEFGRRCDWLLTPRTLNSLRSGNIDTVADLLAKTEKELMSLRVFGKVSLKEVKTLLSGLGLSLKD
jgi:hypothetical protein